MEWFKNHWQQARGGDAKARRKLLLFGSIAIVAVALLVSGQSQPETIRVENKIPESSSSESTTGFMHVSGAVQRPGVYPVNPGMRLFEVIALAGGFTKEADQDSVNLAREVTDGEQVLVTRGGETSNLPGLLNLNRATSTEFDTLPGLGPTLAARIIDWREANGGFKAVDDLRRISGIGDKLFAGIKKLVTL